MNPVCRRCGHCKHLTPEYKKLGAAVEADPALASRLVIAKVDADAHNPLGSRFDVQGFPTIKFFPRGKPATKDSAQDYNGGRSSDAMLAFLKGKLEGDKGFARVAELDAIAEKAGKAAKDDLKKLVGELEEAAKKLEGDAKANGELYVKLAKKALDKGSEYFATERARLERMISSGGVAANKVSEMAAKSSVLGGFLGEPIAAPAAEEEEAEEEPEEDEDDADEVEEGEEKDEE
ncbi:hypothetical protein MNEG_9688 [Monoraphidium neglectum]|uniref:protein disulfide-isomerase n=1 Tax=Monoraphidium neglectum TaxID=145388 RepID=A0A0D2KRT2_9CHLO|nr:hypothetical protein MNEG_9688 [Monoraphidium neglectum]KIY98273.1 hypothetical protein MNEG_9688 [Monoraphidium neglectum]|eukprot:XP_013897293.1 hypothetical protein MNEG_9688 [Monoraphidium neglectum]